VIHHHGRELKDLVQAWSGPLGLLLGRVLLHDRCDGHLVVVVVRDETYFGALIHFFFCENTVQTQTLKYTYIHSLL
jgi:hypothetical protein